MWPANKVKALRVWFSTTKGESLTLDYEGYKEKIYRLVDIEFARFAASLRFVPSTIVASQP